MKRNLILLILVASTLQCFSISDKVRLGIAISPGIAWSSAVGKDLDQGKMRFGVQYGFLVEYWFAKNYGLTTGIGGSLDGCNIKGRDLFNNVNNVQVRNVVEKYTFNYIELPFGIKLKTNDIKGSNFNVWGQVGATANFTVSGRATYSDSIPTLDIVKGTLTGDPVLIEKENILRPKNEITRSIPKFQSNYIDVRLQVGGGFEYSFDDRTSLLVGVYYNNGFINNILDRDLPKKEPNLMRIFSLRVGVLF